MQSPKSKIKCTDLKKQNTKRNIRMLSFWIQQKLIYADQVSVPGISHDRQSQQFPANPMVLPLTKFSQFCQKFFRSIRFTRKKIFSEWHLIFRHLLGIEAREGTIYNCYFKGF